MKDLTHIPELDLVVGSLISTRPDEDYAVFSEERETVSELQRHLQAAGIEIDLLALPGTQIWEGSIESVGALYQLCRLATRLEQDADITPVLEDGPIIYEDDLDRAVTDVWDALKPTRFPHLVHLPGFGSYYLPIDFAQPVVVPIRNEQGEQDEAFVGSSVQLQREVTELATRLQQAGVPSRTSAYQCLMVLRTAAEQSLNFHLPIIFW